MTRSRAPCEAHSAWKPALLGLGDVVPSKQVPIAAPSRHVLVYCELCDLNVGKPLLKDPDLHDVETRVFATLVSAYARSAAALQLLCST